MQINSAAGTIYRRPCDHNPETRFPSTHTLVCPSKCCGRQKHDLQFANLALMNCKRQTHTRALIDPFANRCGAPLYWSRPSTALQCLPGLDYVKSEIITAAYPKQRFYKAGTTKKSLKFWVRYPIKQL